MLWVMGVRGPFFRRLDNTTPPGSQMGLLILRQFDKACANRHGQRTLK